LHIPKKDGSMSTWTMPATIMPGAWRLLRMSAVTPIVLQKSD
jgi:hypothetical protein